MNSAIPPRPVPKQGSFVDTAPFWEGVKNC